MEHGAELEGWNRFIRLFEIAVIGAGHKTATGGAATRGKGEEDAQKRFKAEPREATLLLDSMGGKKFWTY